MSFVRTINRSYLALVIAKNNPGKYTMREISDMVGCPHQANIQHLLDSGALVHSRAKIVKRGKRMFAAITVKLGPVGVDKLDYYSGGAGSLPPVYR